MEGIGHSPEGLAVLNPREAEIQTPGPDPVCV